MHTIKRCTYTRVVHDAWDTISLKCRILTERQARVYNDAVRRALDVMQYEVVVLFVDDRFEYTLDGETVGHEFGGPQHETNRYDHVEQSVNQQ